MIENVLSIIEELPPTKARKALKAALPHVMEAEAVTSATVFRLRLPKGYGKEGRIEPRSGAYVLSHPHKPALIWAHGDWYRLQAA